MEEEFDDDEAFPLRCVAIVVVRLEANFLSFSSFSANVFVTKLLILCFNVKLTRFSRSPFTCKLLLVLLLLILLTLF